MALGGGGGGGLLASCLPVHGWKGLILAQNSKFVTILIAMVYNATGVEFDARGTVWNQHIGCGNQQNQRRGMRVEQLGILWSHPLYFFIATWSNLELDLHALLFSCFDQNRSTPKGACESWDRSLQVASVNGNVPGLHIVFSCTICKMADCCLLPILPTQACCHPWSSPRIGCTLPFWGIKAHLGDAIWCRVWQ